jgi:hypothetical protein
VGEPEESHHTILLAAEPVTLPRIVDKPSGDKKYPALCNHVLRNCDGDSSRVFEDRCASGYCLGIVSSSPVFFNESSLGPKNTYFQGTI